MDTPIISDSGGFPGTGKRDMSRQRMTAALRKQRQRARNKARGLQKIELMVGEEVCAPLARIAKHTGSSVKAEAEVLLKRTVAAYVREIEGLVGRAGEVWIRAEPYLPYAASLQRPGAKFRLGDRWYSYEEWSPIYTELATIYAALGKWGWSRSRIDAFLKRAGREARKREPLKSQPNNPTSR